MDFEFDYVYEITGLIYFVEVIGNQVIEDGLKYTTIKTINIYDDDGSEVLPEHKHYDTIYKDACEREYELEAFDKDFDYYGDVV